MDSLEERVATHRMEILAIAQRNGARNIRMFGSVARRDATRTSDVDFLVDLEPGRDLFDLGGLVMDLQDLLGCRVDVVTENGLSPYLRDAIIAEAVAV